MDLAVANAICYEIIRNNWVNGDFINKHVSFHKGKTNIGYGTEDHFKFTDKAETVDFEEYKAFVDRSVIMVASWVQASLGPLVEKSISVAMSDGRDASIERRFLIDKVWPSEQRHTVDSKVTHRLDSGEFGKQAIGLLKDLRANIALGPVGDYQDHLLEGEAALPDAVVLGSGEEPSDPAED